MRGTLDGFAIGRNQSIWNYRQIRSSAKRERIHGASNLVSTLVLGFAKADTDE